MYTKINFNHNFNTISQGKEYYKFGKYVNDRFHGITYYEISDNQITEKLLSIIPYGYRKLFVPSLMVINIKEVPIHIDNEIKSNINFYIKTSGAVTNFHKKIIKNPEIEKLENHTNGKLFTNKKEMTIVGNFKAEENETWLLDVTQPHSVICEHDHNRIAYCLSTKYLTYKNLYEILKKIVI